MFGFSQRRKKQDFSKIAPPLTRQKLMEFFNVPFDTPLLHAVLAVLRGIEEEHAEDARMVSNAVAEKAQHTAAMFAVQDARDRLVDLVAKAQEAASATRKAKKRSNPREK